jgi:hypothetical protein
MNPLDGLMKSFSTAFDSIINVKAIYRDNDVSFVQTGLIILLPQITAYLITYNQIFGIKLGVKLESYPVLLLIFLVCGLYVICEPRIPEKKANAVLQLALLSIHIFGFALGLNLIYAAVIQIFGFDDLIQAHIFNWANINPGNLTPPVFALLYGTPFLLVSLAIVFRNTLREATAETKATLRTVFFWRTFMLATALAFYQYMVFILIGASAVKGG